MPAGWVSSPIFSTQRRGDCFGTAEWTDRGASWAPTVCLAHRRQPNDDSLVDTDSATPAGLPGVGLFPSAQVDARCSRRSHRLVSAELSCELLRRRPVAGARSKAPRRTEIASTVRIFTPSNSGSSGPPTAPPPDPSRLCTLTPSSRTGRAPASVRSSSATARWASGVRVAGRARREWLRVIVVKSE